MSLYEDLPPPVVTGGAGGGGAPASPASASARTAPASGVLVGSPLTTAAAGTTTLAGRPVAATALSAATAATGWSQQARVMIAPIRRKTVLGRPAVPAVLRVAQRTDAVQPDGGSTGASSSGPTVLTDSLPMEMPVWQDEYDPAKPNDLDELKERLAAGRDLHDRERVERKRQRDEDDRDDRRAREAARYPPPPPSSVLVPASVQSSSASSARADQLGEEAFAARARLSHTAPAEAAAVDMTGEEAFLARGRLSATPTAAPAPAATPASAPADAGNRGERLMAKMGWKAGQGLGKDSALAPSVGGAAPPPAATKARGFGQPAEPSRAALAELSRVVLLTNMVGPGEVDASLEEETAEECTKFGHVERCVIYEVPRGKVPDEEAVRIFIKFAAPDMAARAVAALNGRFFAKRSVRAEHFDEGRFDRRELAPSL